VLISPVQVTTTVFTSTKNSILMKLCGLILYMVTRKFLHSSSHEFCDIVVKLVNYGCDIVVKPIMLLSL
jgi:hypothetical protein